MSGQALKRVAAVVFLGFRVLRVSFFFFFGGGVVVGVWGSLSSHVIATNALTQELHPRLRSHFCLSPERGGF